MKTTKTDGKFEAVIGESRLPKNPNDMSTEETAKFLAREAKREKLIDFLVQMTDILPETYYDTIIDMGKRVVEASEASKEATEVINKSIPSGTVSLVIVLNSSPSDASKIVARAEIKRQFKLELGGAKTPPIDLWRDGLGGFTYSDPDQPELGL